MQTEKYSQTIVQNRQCCKSCPDMSRANYCLVDGIDGFNEMSEVYNRGSGINLNICMVDFVYLIK